MSHNFGASPRFPNESQANYDRRQATEHSWNQYNREARQRGETQQGGCLLLILVPVIGILAVGLGLAVYLIA